MSNTAFNRVLIRIAALGFAAAALADPEPPAQTFDLSVTPSGATNAVALPFQMPLAFPGEASCTLAATNTSFWLDADSLRLVLAWPEGAPRYSGGLVWLKDRDDIWHQQVFAKHLSAGTTNVIEIPFGATAAGWTTPGHSLAWHYRARLNPQSIGFRVFADNTFTGRCEVVSATLTVKPPAGAPQIMRARALTSAPRVLEKFELRFDLPDRYANPFDPETIDAGAKIITPSGVTNTITAFYYQPYYRLEDELGEPVEPAGRPEWRIRYCPREPGEYRVSLFAKDRWGEAAAESAATFSAAPAGTDPMRFVRVSAKDRRFFEFDNGDLYYPIGHNTRSANDARMNDKFPWIFRKEESTAVYRRYFQQMQASGENWAEVWMSAWSLGLEWTEGIGGYHGAGDYHSGNAWELDRVLELAEKHRIHINLVLNYHGRMSSWCDPEWHLHPYNKLTPGGWLEMPLQFFDDPKAVAMQKRFIRYTQARWGWSPAIFGYELCSEINLTGHESHHRTNFDPRVVNWCKVMSEYFEEIDPYQHLVSAHVSNDYNYICPEHAKLPTLDFNPLDAYHHTLPERIIALAAETANFGLQFDKPILITEFGGSPMAAGKEHLKIELHAALWTGVCVPLAGTPMFWWWRVVEENNLYPYYAAVAKFMEGEDPRDPAAKMVRPVIGAVEGKTAPQAANYLCIGTVSPRSARCYVYPKSFPRPPAKPISAEFLTATIKGLEPGTYRAEFFDTRTGKSTAKRDTRTENGTLVLSVPKFSNDCAFKLHQVTAIAPKAN